MPRLPSVTNATRAIARPPGPRAGRRGSFDGDDRPPGTRGATVEPQPRSTHMAMPMPPPMHSVAKPLRAAPLHLVGSDDQHAITEAPIG